MITSFKEFINESEYMNKAMSFAEIKDKYENNPYGIGANSVEFIEGKFGNSNILVFRHDNKYDRDKMANKLKSMGISPKKITKSTADSAYAYKYEVNLFESEFVNEEKMSLNSTIKTSSKEYTWIYQTGNDAVKTAVEINKKLNELGIKSFISKTTGDTVAIPTKELQKSFDEVISKYSNIKQFAYGDGTKLNKEIVNESSNELNESGLIKIGNSLADDLKEFLTDTVIPKSK